MRRLLCGTAALGCVQGCYVAQPPSAVHFQVIGTSEGGCATAPREVHVPATPDDAVHVHSVQEEYFYLMVHPCPCGGAWQSGAQQVEERPPLVTHRVAAQCFKCGREQEFRFALDGPAHSKGHVRLANPTSEPSRALDAADWLGLAEFYLGRIERLTEAVEKAQSLFDTRQCLEEALKFYGPADDAPPAAALWSDASRRKAAAKAKAFHRSTIEAMLARIPPMDQLRKADSMEQKEFDKGVRDRAVAKVGKWWQFWKRWRR